MHKISYYIYRVKYIIGLFLLFTINLVFGQAFNGKLIIGINGSQIDGDRMGGFHKAGIVAGAAVEYAVNDAFSFQPEILYSQKGSRSAPKDPLFMLWRLSYLEVPLLFNYKLKNGLIFHAGASVGYLMKANFDDGYGFIDRTLSFERLDGSALLGMSYVFSEQVILNIRYTRSLVPITQENFEAFYNSTLSVTLRWVLRNQSGE